MLENNETMAGGVDAQAVASSQSYTEAILMTAATALVGFLMVYLMFFDSAALL